MASSFCPKNVPPDWNLLLSINVDSYQLVSSQCPPADASWQNVEDAQGPLDVLCDTLPGLQVTSADAPGNLLQLVKVLQLALEYEITRVSK